MIKSKLDEGDLALLECIEDPIFCSELMRTTRDLSPNKEVWLKRPFELRWYQKDLITDTSDYIVLTSGRAAGKCQSPNSRVYTTEGYRSITMLLRKKCFEVYCVDNDGNLQTRRAFVEFDKYATVYKLTTKSNHIVYASANHPVHTDRGYVRMDELTTDDRVSVVTHLPYDNPQRLMRPEEIRYLGYIFLSENVRPEVGFLPRFKQIRVELQKLCELLDLTYTEDMEGKVYLKRKKGYGKHPLATVLQQMHMLGFWKGASYNDPKKVPRTLSDAVKAECNDNTRIFLEALLAQSAELKRDSVTLRCGAVKTARDLHELFLRHGIEMVYDNDGIMTTLDQRAVYRIYSQFDIPGVSANVSVPAASFDYHSNFRYDPIQSVEMWREKFQTYAIYVYDHHNYITDNVLVHNSLVLEDKIITDIINQDTKYPETKEMLLTTANQAQIDPVLSRIITRATTSPILKEALGNRVNKSLGTLDFRFNDVQFIMRARIAGGNKESNIV